MVTLLVQIPVCVNDIVEQDLGRLTDGCLVGIAQVEVFYLGFFASPCALGDLVVERCQRGGGVLAFDQPDDIVLLLIQRVRDHHLQADTHQHGQVNPVDQGAIFLRNGI